MPFLEAQAKSILSKPAPARATTFKLFEASITSFVILSLRTIIASTSFTASKSSCFVLYFSNNLKVLPDFSIIPLISFTVSFVKGFSVANNIVDVLIKESAASKIKANIF